LGTTPTPTPTQTPTPHINTLFKNKQLFYKIYYKL